MHTTLVWPKASYLQNIHVLFFILAFQEMFFCLSVSGVLPHFLQEKVPAMMGCETGVLSPTHDVPEELDLNSGIKKRNRRSFGGKSVPWESYKLQFAEIWIKFWSYKKELYWCIHNKSFSGNTKICAKKMVLGHWRWILLFFSKCFTPFGLCHVSDMVNGALSKIKTNRTPTSAPQSDSLGRYCGQLSCYGLPYSMIWL